MFWQFYEHISLYNSIMNKLYMLISNAQGVSHLIGITSFLVYLTFIYFICNGDFIWKYLFSFILNIDSTHNE